MSTVSGYPLYGYNLKIYDDEYLDSIASYSSVGEDVQQCWSKFIALCRDVLSQDLKGDFSNQLSTFIDGIGTLPGDNFNSEVVQLTKNMQAYISQIDKDDVGIY